MGHIVPGSFWLYDPTKGVSIAFAVLFAISGILHIWQNHIKYRSWRIGFLLPWSASLFVGGFILREIGAYQYHNLNIFIASTVLLFCAPPVYAGANYFIFGRALYYIPYLSPLHPGRVWTTFIGLDGVVEVLAGNGASKAANRHATPEIQKAGLALVRASLVMQLVLFLAFVSLVIVFHIRCLRAGVFSYKIKVIIYELYTTSFLILIRNIFRTATFFVAYTSYANANEWCFWIFEVLPMVVTTYVYNVYPPAKYMPAGHKIYLAKDGKTEIEGPGMVDKRFWLLTVIDPCDIGGLITGKDRKNRFWECDGIGGPKEEQQEVVTKV